jgi:hypothetical protein
MADDALIDRLDRTIDDLMARRDATPCGTPSWRRSCDWRRS